MAYPGVFVKDQAGDGVQLRRRPPLIGEHNGEIYQGEMGLSPSQLAALKEGKVI